MTDPTSSPPSHATQDPYPIDLAHGFVAMLLGVSGTGKTTLGELLSQRLHADFIDADDFHSDAAKEKMRSGHPLDDRDREPWLARIQRAVHQWRCTGRRVIFACSGLRKKYRLVLAELAPPSSILDPTPPQLPSPSSYPPSTPAFSPFFPSPLYTFLLHAPPSVLLSRISARKGHYFPASLLRSQLDTLEWPGVDEDVVVVDVSGSKEAVVEVIAAAIVQRGKSSGDGEHGGGEVGEGGEGERWKGLTAAL